MNPPIAMIGHGFDVAPMLQQLERHPEWWDRYRQRTTAYQTPHKAVSDIWFRYNDWANFDGDMAKFNEEHESVWYPVIADIPAGWSLARKVMRHVSGKQLGGVLMTRIPPGGEVKPHIDHGWHAGHYEKFAVQIKGNKDQAFCFDGVELSAEPGDLYTFDNSQTHWVRNDSDSERITLIICIRRDANDS